MRIRVLFVCMGNICRSPMAEAVFVHLVKEAGLKDKIEADSAGCGDWQVGNPPHRGTRRILQEQGIEYSGTARCISHEDLNNFAYILTMDDENLRHVRELQRKVPTAKAHIAPLLDYSPLAKEHRIREVPDPYLVGGFDTVHRLIQAGCIGLLDTIRREHKL